jgi:hypothetical protein
MTTTDTPVTSRCECGGLASHQDQCRWRQGYGSIVIPSAPDTRWDDLRAEIRRSRDIYDDAANDHGEIPGHDMQEQRAYGRVEMCDQLLAWMKRADEQEG